jgi:inhibitor of cysteine peptidase
MVHVDESQNGNEIELLMGETFELCLSENPTTGFRWSLVSSGAPPCSLVEDWFQASTMTPGTAGSHCWRFQATQIGEGRIELGYRRSWERQGAAGRAFTLRVRVAK